MIFLADPHQLLGDAPRRPFSLGSEAALAALGITVMDPAHGLSSAEESRQIRCYDFIHTAPLADVRLLASRAAWPDDEEPLSDATIAAFRVMRDEVRALVAAADYRIRLRAEEKKAVEKEPLDLKPPSLLAIQIRRIARETGWGRDFILWELPKWEALALMHAAHWHEGRQTIAPCSPPKATPSDLTPEWMTNIDTPPSL